MTAREKRDKFWAEFYAQFKCPVAYYHCALASTNGFVVQVTFRLEQN